MSVPRCFDYQQVMMYPAGAFKRKYRTSRGVFLFRGRRSNIRGGKT